MTSFFLNVKSSLLMQYHLADPTILYFDERKEIMLLLVEKNPGRICSKMSTKSLG